MKAHNQIRMRALEYGIAALVEKHATLVIPGIDPAFQHMKRSTVCCCHYGQAIRELKTIKKNIQAMDKLQREKEAGSAATD